MLSSIPDPALKESHPNYGRLSVNVIAERLPSIGLETKQAEAQRLLLAHPALVLVDAKRKVLGLLTPEQTLAAVDATGHKQWLQALYQQTPEHFNGPVIANGAVVQSAESLFRQSRFAFLPIVDQKGRYTGQCVSATLLSRLRMGTLRPPRIGGLATPLGVYMTSGFYASGAGWPGLLATGFLFGLLARALEWIAVALFSVLIMLYPPIQLLPMGEQTILEGGLLLASLMALLRLSPMSGLHAAEHMTINAIERDLPLTESMVRTQPREHQRCGTNLVVLLLGVQVIGVSVYFGLSRMNGLGLVLYSGFWLWLVLTGWKPAGLWMQRHFTTKDPTSPQLASGIRAGQELLEKFAARPHGMPSFFRRLWGAGLFQMMASFILAFWLLGLLLAQWGLS